MKDNIIIRKITYLFLVTFLVSCAYSPVPKYLKKEFTFCYDDKETGLDTTINIEGYYTERVIGENDLTGKLFDLNRHDSSGHTHFMFFKNGLCVFGLPYFPDGIPAALRKIINSENKKNNFFYKGDVGIYWGKYQICGDTIKLQVTNHPALMSPTWMSYEAWYKIIDKNTLQPIAYRNLDIYFYLENKKVNQIMIIDTKKHLPATFTPLKEKPDPKYCWLLWEKWFWCNENDYKKWKEAQKKKR